MGRGHRKVVGRASRSVDRSVGLPAACQRGQFRRKPPVGRGQIRIDVGQHVDTLEEQRANMISPGVNPFSDRVRKINRYLQ